MRTAVGSALSELCQRVAVRHVRAEEAARRDAERARERAEREAAAAARRAAARAEKEAQEAQRAAARAEARAAREAVREGRAVVARGGRGEVCAEVRPPPPPCARGQARCVDKVVQWLVCRAVEAAHGEGGGGGGKRKARADAGSSAEEGRPPLKRAARPRATNWAQCNACEPGCGDLGVPIALEGTRD